MLQTTQKQHAPVRRVATVVSMKQLAQDDGMQQNGDCAMHSKQQQQQAVSQCRGCKLPMYIYSDHAPSKAQRGPYCTSWDGTEDADTGSPLYTEGLR